MKLYHGTNVEIDTIAYFNKNYVHTEKFPREIGRAIAKAAKYIERMHKV